MATIQVLIDAKVAGLGQVGELDASVQKLGTSTTGLGGSLDSTTQKLNASGAAHGAVSREAQALEGSLSKTTGQVDLAGAAHTKAAGSAQVLGAQLGTVSQQAAGAATQAETLGTKLTALQSSTGLVNATAKDASTAVQDLAAATSQNTAATAASIDPMQASQAAITNLAVVDGTLGTAKKKTAELVKEEEAVVEKAKAAHEAHAEAVLKGVKATGEFGEAGVAASEKLGVLSGVLGGAGGISAGLAGAVVALGAAAAIAKTSVETFVTLGESVLKYERVTGDSAEQSSRMVSVFGQLGVGGDGAGNAMFTLSKRIEGVDGAATKGSKTLADLGVAVVRTKDGSADLDKTLMNVADAYANATSGAQKDLIATTAFGKSAKDMIPILEQGSEGLRKMADSAQLVFNQQQLEQVHQWNLEQAKAGQEASSVGMTIGGLLLPQMIDLGQRATDAAAGIRYASAAQKEVGLTSAQNAVAFGELYGKGVDLAAQGRRNADANKDEAASIQQLNNELKREEQDRQDLLNADVAGVQASLNLQRAYQGVLNAQKTLADETAKDALYAHQHQAAIDKVTAAQANLTAAVKAHGPASLQAKQAQDALNAARDAGTTLDRTNAEAAGRLAAEELTLKDAMLRDVAAADAAAQQQAKLSGGHLSARDSAAAQAAELEQLKAAAGGVLPAELQVLLDKLNSFHDVSATVHLRLSDETGGMRMGTGTLVTSAEGGIFTRPTLTWVGESGPEAVIPLRAGNTMPGASALPAGLSAPSSSRTYNVTQYITGAIDAQAAGDAAVAALSQMLTSS